MHNFVTSVEADNFRQINKKSPVFLENRGFFYLFRQSAATAAAVVVAAVAAAVSVVAAASKQNHEQNNDPAASAIVVFKTHSSFLLKSIYLKQSVLRCFILHSMRMSKMCDRFFCGNRIRQ